MLWSILKFLQEHVDDAITEALIQLGATSDQIEYEVIEKGSTGFSRNRKKRCCNQGS